MKSEKKFSKKIRVPGFFLPAMKTQSPTKINAQFFLQISCNSLFFVYFVCFVVEKNSIPASFGRYSTKSFQVFKKPDFSEKSGFSENAISENL